MQNQTTAQLSQAIKLHDNALINAFAYSQRFDAYQDFEGDKDRALDALNRDGVQIDVSHVSLFGDDYTRYTITNRADKAKVYDAHGKEIKTVVKNGYTVLIPC